MLNAFERTSGDKAGGGKGGEGSSSNEKTAAAVEAASPSADRGGGFDEASYWKTRFHELSERRETAAEKELALFREHAAERDRRSRQYIAHLRCDSCVRTQKRATVDKYVMRGELRGTFATDGWAFRH